MANSIADAPVRATKAPPRSKTAPASAAPAQPSAEGSPKPPSITEDEALVASTLAEQLMAIYSKHWEQMSFACIELLHAATEALAQPQDGQNATYRAAALVHGAIAVERADKPGSPAIVALEAIRQSLKSASESFMFEQVGCEAMAEGIRAGQRQYRQRPTPPIRRVEEESEGLGPTALTRKQLLTVLEVAASNLATIDNILMQAQTEKDSWALAGLVDAAQALSRHCGGMVDTAAGEAVRGGHNYWNFGPNFADLGKAGAA